MNLVKNVRGESRREVILNTRRRKDPRLPARGALPLDTDDLEARGGGIQRCTVSVFSRLVRSSLALRLCGT